MPQGAMEDEPVWPLPKDVPLPAKLMSVQVRTIKWNDRRSGEAKSRDVWSWEFQITEGQYAGLTAKGEGPAKITNHPDNNSAQWFESIRQRPIEMGESVNTDDILGADCVIVVDNTSRDREGGGKWYDCPVVDVFPKGAYQTDDPPF